MTGGDDIDPSRYGMERDPKCGKSNPLQDSGELAMLETFVKTGKPILCVCRGQQLMNVFCGGTLHQDITGFQKCSHSDFASRARWTHQVEILPGTRLESILGEGKCRVNSIHHQAVANPAPGLTVSAVSEDGIVEGLEKPDHPFFLGVQWHPEHMSRVDLRQRRIFDAFVQACGKK
jgi:putative glutamine amidotransferase